MYCARPRLLETEHAVPIFLNDAREKLAQLTGTEELLEEMTGHQVGNNRKKRGVLNFLGQLSKVLFGTMDDNDAKYYNEQVNLFAQNSEDMTTLLKQQLYVVKSSLGAVNNTLADVEYNERVLQE
jgi:hypothetical protein